MWLLRLPGMTNKKAAYLLDYFDGAEEIYREINHIRCPAISSSEHFAMHRSVLNGDLNKYIEEIHNNGIEFIDINNAAYPHMLKNIYDPPLGFYYAGTLPDDSIAKIAVVGTRKCGAYGRSAALELSKELSEAGFVIVSGFALGIDSAAHRGALAAEGVTVGVLGSGLNVNYPYNNAELRKLILERGCLISEYPPDYKPTKYSFPARNRVISGLCAGTLVVEAPRFSGALITAHLAAEQGREVFVVPGNYDSPLSEGSNALIRDGAAIALSADDIIFGLSHLLEIASQGRSESPPQPRPSGKASAPKPPKTDIPKIILANEEKMIYDCLCKNFECGKERVTADELLEYIPCMDTGALALALFNLEADGVIARFPGNGIELV